LKTKKIIRYRWKRLWKWRDYFETAEKVRYHRYQIEYSRREYEIVCPRYTLADGRDVTVIPWYLIPGRPYPIQVYLYACSLYSTNPGIGQRGAAEATRAKFKLESFSHSTVSRSFRALEYAQKLSLDNRFGEEVKVFGAGSGNIVVRAAKTCAKSNSVPNCIKSFPSAADTAKRRGKMAVFFRGVNSVVDEVNIKAIEAAGRQFVEDWHEKTGRLLL